MFSLCSVSKEGDYKTCVVRLTVVFPARNIKLALRPVIANLFYIAAFAIASLALLSEDVLDTYKKSNSAVRREEHLPDHRNTNLLIPVGLQTERAG